MAWDHWVANNGKPFFGDQICQRRVVQMLVDFSSGLILTCSESKSSNKFIIGLGWVREWQALYDQAPKVWSEQKKSIYTWKFTSSFSPKLVKSLIWNSGPWSHLTPRSNNQASFIQGHLQHLDQG